MPVWAMEKRAIGNTIATDPLHRSGAGSSRGCEPPAGSWPFLASVALSSTPALHTREAQWRLLHLQQLLQLEREVERRHLARELHDELGQHLTAMQLALAPLLTSSPDGPAHRLALLIEQALASLRRIVANWGPAALEGKSPSGALRALGRETSERMGFEVRMRVSGTEGAVPKPVALALYRIVQESLTNIARHACANRARVHVRWQPRSVTLLIEDDGVGLPDDALTRPHCHGLRGLQERVAALGGRLAFSAARGGGTRLVAELPLAAATPSPLDTPA